MQQQVRGSTCNAILDAPTTSFDVFRDIAIAIGRCSSTNANVQYQDISRADPGAQAPVLTAASSTTTITPPWKEDGTGARGGQII